MHNQDTFRYSLPKMKTRIDCMNGRWTTLPDQSGCVVGIKMHTKLCPCVVQFVIMRHARLDCGVYVENNMLVVKFLNWYLLKVMPSVFSTNPT